MSDELLRRAAKRRSLVHFKELNYVLFRCATLHEHTIALLCCSFLEFVRQQRQLLDLAGVPGWHGAQNRKNVFWDSVLQIHLDLGGVHAQTQSQDFARALQRADVIDEQIWKVQWSVVAHVLVQPFWKDVDVADSSVLVAESAQ